eukprot:Filipodium_phascolosomae@DN1803_c0_g1_i1.p1
MASGITSDVDQFLEAWLKENPNVVAYVIINSEGIGMSKYCGRQHCFVCSGVPIKFPESLPYEEAVHLSAVMKELVVRSKKCLRQLLADPESDFSSVRVRTRHMSEYMIVGGGDYSLITVQSFNTTSGDRTHFVSGSGNGAAGAGVGSAAKSGAAVG